MQIIGSQTGEGLEYFILLFGLAISLLIMGGGKASIDSLLET
jgi:putative oxidoreductase